MCRGGPAAAPGITVVLWRYGRQVDRKRVERIMREHGILGITRCRRRGLTRPGRKAAPSPDVVARDFTAAEPGTKLVSGITCLPTPAGWWYLATVIGLVTCEVVGCAMADHHRAGLVADALRTAVGRGGLKEGCVAHPDRGSEYSSREYRTFIGELGLRQSVGRAGSCCDNAAAESFSDCCKRRSVPRSGHPARRLAPTSFASSRSSATAPACASTRSTDTSPRSKPGPWQR
ncbi:DDE-type integrase/transposase/recombinase [Streptomyces sp. NPDC057596]|uniref:DDE-type integrase/transposase/recombinase n=1 Tax=Streptomyces sp. NPDC057596 TaxID=3346178 RepID=UPI0036C9E1D6